MHTHVSTADSIASRLARFAFGHTEWLRRKSAIVRRLDAIGVNILLSKVQEDANLPVQSASGPIPVVRNSPCVGTGHDFKGIFRIGSSGHNHHFPSLQMHMDAETCVEPDGRKFCTFIYQYFTTGRENTAELCAGADSPHKCVTTTYSDFEKATCWSCQDFVLYVNGEVKDVVTLKLWFEINSYGDVEWCRCRDTQCHDGPDGAKGTADCKLRKFNPKRGVQCT